jgi:hypothetical protein
MGTIKLDRSFVLFCVLHFHIIHISPTPFTKCETEMNGEDERRHLDEATHKQNRFLGVRTVHKLMGKFPRGGSPFMYSIKRICLLLGMKAKIGGKWGINVPNAQEPL